MVSPVSSSVVTSLHCALSFSCSQSTHPPYPFLPLAFAQAVPSAWSALPSFLNFFLKKYLFIYAALDLSWASLVAQMVKNLPAMWETWVRSLGWEDPLEEGMATHSSILAWGIPMDRGVWRAIYSMGLQTVGQD